MDSVEKFFVGPYWAALTGTVTLLAAVVPLVLGMSKSLERRRLAFAGPIKRPLRMGCSKIFMSGTVNFGAFLLYGALGSGFSLSIVGVSPQNLREDYLSAMGRMYTLEDFAETAIFGCGFMCLANVFFLILFICSIVAALRYGYEYGVYTIVLGTCSTGFPLNLGMVSSIPAYAALPTPSKFYIVAVSVVAGILASVVVLAMTWFIVRSMYQPATET